MDPAEPKAAAPYRLLGVVDPDRGNMVAFALKVPRDWQVEQSFTRRWDGPTPQNLVYLKLRAPDGRAQIEYLPSATYIYTEGPTAMNMRAQAQMMGMDLPRAANELAPMPALVYLKQMFLPWLMQNGLALANLGHDQETAPAPDGGSMQSRASVDGTLPDGRRARVECRLSLSAQSMNGDTFYGWTVVPSITQSADDLEAAYAHTRAAQESIVRNPAWVAAEQQTQQQGRDMSRQQHEMTMSQIHANTQAMTAAHNQRMADIQWQGAANTARHHERMADMDRDMASFNARMASQDRQHEYGIDAIRGVSQYQDPATGDRVKIEDGYDHVYRNQQDPTLYYAANTPLDPQQVDWQELQKVSLSHY